MGLQQRKRNNV